jgi:transglutaminase-like putative cysteine protease
MTSVLKYRGGLVLLALVNMLPALEVEQSWGLFSIAVAAALVSQLLSSKRFAVRQPSWLILIMVIASIGALAYDMVVPSEEPTVYIVDLAHFIILLCCCKFFELHGGRDMALVLLICFLLLIISAFVSASPLFGIVLVLDATVGLWWLLRFQHARELAAAVESHRSVMGVDPSAQPALPEPASASLGSTMRVGAICSLCLFIAALVCFVTLPRGWGRGWVGRLQRLAPATMTGFDDEVRLRDVPIFEDDTVVMRVRFKLGEQQPDPTEFSPHMRGLSFDRYYGGAWQNTPSLSSLRLVIPEESETLELDSAAAFLEEEDLLVQDVWLERVARGVLFAVESPVLISSGDLREIHQNPVDQTLQTPDRLSRSVSYEVKSLTGKRAEEAKAAESRRLRRPRRAISNIDPKVREFSQEFCARYGDPTDISQHAFLVRKICSFLSSGRFQYTLNRPELPKKSDPIKDFLLDSHQGHCEYFASAMTLMCQSVGIPARLVSGYAGGEYNPVGGFWVMRRKDAHAWVEVFLPGRAWTAFDPSPALQTRRDLEGSGLLAQALRFIDFARFKWSSGVVTFDTQSRYDLKERFEKWFSQLISRDETQISFGQAMRTMLWGPELIPLWQRVFYWLLLILCVVFVALMGRIIWIVSLMVREYLPRRSRHGRRQTRRSGAKFYDRLLVLLANKGHAKPGHFTPREFAANVSHNCPDLAELPVFVEWFYEAQFGRRSLGSDRWESLKGFLQRLREDRAFGVKP